MLLKKLTLLGVGSVALVALASMAIAGPIEDRQAAMKQNGKSIGALVAIMKGEAAYDPAVVKASTDTMLADFEAFLKSFPEGSETGTAETWAKPEIWSDMEGFQKAGETAITAAKALAATADEASFKAAFPAVGEACNNCHDKFRRPKE